MVSCTLNNRRPLIFMRFLFVLAAGLLLQFAPRADSLSEHFFPGRVWRDTEGHPINAHAGGVLFHADKYYWYGESKSGRTYLPDCNQSWGGTRVDVSGVSCYASANLYDWKNEGLALAAVPDDPRHDLHPSKVVERPKVIYNRAAKQFVMWMHIDSTDYSAARLGVAVSSAPTGPFKYLGSFRPDAGAWPANLPESERTPAAGNAVARDFKSGQMAHDMTLFVDDDEKAYVVYASEDNATMHVSALTDDYLRTAGKYARILVGRSMEAPVVFKHQGKYCLIASGCTAWAPNAARAAVADSIFGPWKELGNPCVGKDSETTFQSQGTFVLPAPHAPGRFIFMADRWSQWDLAESRCIWLPLEFEQDGKPLVRWRDSWSLLDLQTSVHVQRAP
jgi:hypothetical protein